MRNVQLRIRAVIPTPRTARLVLVSASGAYVGALPPVAVATPWWQDIAPVVQAAREQYGIEVVVLRLLGGELPQPPGGEVTYLAQVDAQVESKCAVARTVGRAGRTTVAPRVRASRRTRRRPRVGAIGARTPRHAHDRAARADPNLEPVERLALAGRRSVRMAQGGAAVHGARRTTAGGTRRTRRCATVLGHDGGRCLLAEVPGTDLYDATPAQLIDMVTLLVRLQLSWVGRLDSLLALGLPDWRGAALTRDIAEVLRRTSHELANDDVQALSAFVADLPRSLRGHRALRHTRHVGARRLPSRATFAATTPR